MMHLAIPCLPLEDYAAKVDKNIEIIKVLVDHNRLDAFCYDGEFYIFCESEDLVLLPHGYLN